MVFSAAPLFRVLPQSQQRPCPPQEIHAAAAPPPLGVVAKVAFVSSIPFIGFGFCDNSIMVCGRLAH